MTRLLLAMSLLSASAWANVTPSATDDSRRRASELRGAIDRERPGFDVRENQKRDILEQLDHLNADQNAVRQRVDKITAEHQEIAMALENLAIETEKYRNQEKAYRTQLVHLLKTVYELKEEGIIRFLSRADSFTQAFSRLRMLMKTLKSQTLVSRQFTEKTNRLGESEKRLTQAKTEQQRLLTELTEQQEILGQFLKKKHAILKSIGKRQGQYKTLVKEYRSVSRQVATLFDDLEMERDPNSDITASNGMAHLRGKLPLPLLEGTVIGNFGKSVNKAFQTVVFKKGIEIETGYQTPVKAVLPGIIEYDGWVKGLGNVVIIHHGAGLYSLSAHLFKNVATKGAKVLQGDTIGLVGDTGSNEKPSLYFEIRENGRAVDPLNFFSTTALASLK